MTGSVSVAESTSKAKAKRIVICATQRSGSTLLCEDLRNNGLGRAEEHFLTIMGKEPPADLARSIKRIEQAGTGDNGVFAVKIMGNYAPRIDEALLSLGFGGAGGGLWSGIRDYFGDALWIYIERRSVLRQAVSRLMAKQTGINHAVASADAQFVPGKTRIGHDASYNANVSYKQDELEQYVLDIVAENQLWERFFDEHAIAPIHLVYEEIASSADYISQVRPAVGLPASSIDANRQLVKLSNDRSEEIVRKFIASRSGMNLLEAAKKAVAPAKAAVTASIAGGAKKEVLAAPPPEPQPKGLDGLRQTTAVVTRRWAATPYYDAVESLAQAQWDKLIVPFLGATPIDYSNVLELACGHGRMTAILLGKSNHVLGVDVLQENIDFCTKRFAGVDKLTLIRNDGVTLKEIADGSVSFVFCFDSMVHFDSDVVRTYLGEFRRVLKPGGYGFLHHSNHDKNPEGDFQKSAHARNFMTDRLFRHYAHKEGVEVAKQRVIDWGAGDKRVEKHDCLSLIRRA